MCGSVYDDFGSLLTLPGDFVVQMEAGTHPAGIPFNPVMPLVSLVMNHRDHRKLVVIDGTVAYTAGFNLGGRIYQRQSALWLGRMQRCALRVRRYGILP